MCSLKRESNKIPALIGPSVNLTYREIKQESSRRRRDILKYNNQEKHKIQQVFPSTS